jgi:ssDNA-binding Zn-finger/Zn-ribbon topoisomerase 1
MKLRHAQGVECNQPRNIEVIIHKDITCPRCRTMLKEDPKLKDAFNKLIIEAREKRTIRAKAILEKNNLMIHDVSCPKCGSSLKVRKNKRDDTSFYGCSGYPACKFSKNFPGAPRKSALQMPFGKHKGKSLERIPINYLRWLAQQTYCPSNVKRFVNKTKDLI